MRHPKSCLSTRARVELSAAGFGDRPVKDEIISAIAVILANPSVSEQERQAVLHACRSGAPVKPIEMVTLKRAAEILQVHPKSVRRYTQQGLLHPVRYSKRKYRYPLLQVENFAACGIQDQA